jgi:hypothetical protein
LILNARPRRTLGPGPLLPFGALLVALASIAAITTIAAPAPAAADWLVTSEGARVETHGPWQVKGKLIVFTGADGTLSSLRLSQVDLEASKHATEDKQKMVEEDISVRTPERKKPVRSITDKDVGHGGKADSANPADPGAPAAPGARPADGKAGKADAAPAPAAPALPRTSPLTVGPWQKLERREKDGIELFGELKNGGGDIAAQVGLTVSLFDETGKQIASTEAVLTGSAIEPLSTTNFRAIFPGVFTFASAKFEPRSAQLQMQTAEPPKDKKNL